MKKYVNTSQTKANTELTKTIIRITTKQPKQQKNKTLTTTAIHNTKVPALPYTLLDEHTTNTSPALRNDDGDFYYYTVLLFGSLPAEHVHLFVLIQMPM